MTNKIPPATMPERARRDPAWVCPLMADRECWTSCHAHREGERRHPNRKRAGLAGPEVK